MAPPRGGWPVERAREGRSGRAEKLSSLLYVAALQRGLAKNGAVNTDRGSKRTGGGEGEKGKPQT